MSVHRVEVLRAAVPHVRAAVEELRKAYARWDDDEPADTVMMIGIQVGARLEDLEELLRLVESEARCEKELGI